MKPYLVKTPKFVKWIFPKRVWSLQNTDNVIYLTFDDGPIPQVTPWVLNELKKNNARATFFCIGDNIKKHPVILKQIISEGHVLGNHTFNHLNGWRTSTSDYIENIEKTHSIISKYTLPSIPKSNTLFRPPYGKITTKQSKILLQKEYKIIMWDVLSGDYNTKVSKEKCLQNVINNLQPGSIVVFHDSLKAQNNLKYVLPRVLNYINTRGYKCRVID